MATKRQDEREEGKNNHFVVEKTEENTESENTESKKSNENSKGRLEGKEANHCRYFFITLMSNARVKEKGKIIKIMIELAKRGKRGIYSLN